MSAITQVSGLLIEDPGLTLRPEDCAGRPAGAEVGPAEPNTTGPGIAQLVTRWAPRDAGVTYPSVLMRTVAPGSPYASTASGEQANFEARADAGPFLGWRPPWVHCGTSAGAALSGSATVVDLAAAPARDGDTIDAERVYLAVIRSDGVLTMQRIEGGVGTGGLQTVALGLSSAARCAVLGYRDRAKTLVIDGRILYVIEHVVSGTGWVNARITATADSIVVPPGTPAFLRLCAAHRDGQAVLFGTAVPSGGDDNAVIQLASYDDGWTWQTVKVVTDGVAVADCAASVAGIHVIHANEADTSASPARPLRHSILSGPGLAWDEADFIRFGTALYTNPAAGEVAQSAHGLSVQEDGRLVVVARNGEIATSDDYGASWLVTATVANGTSRDYLWAQTTDISRLRAVPHLGRTLALTTHDDPAEEARRNVRFDFLGGWATFAPPVNRPEAVGNVTTLTAVPRTLRTVLAYALPGAYGYTVSGAGTPALVRDGIAISGGTVIMSRAALAPIPMRDYVIGKIEVSWTGTQSGASAISPAFIEVRSGDGSGDGVELRTTITSDTVAIYEQDGPSFILLASAPHTAGQTRVTLFVSAFGTALGDLRVEARVYASGSWVEAASVGANSSGVVRSVGIGQAIKHNASDVVGGISGVIVHSMGENVGPVSFSPANADGLSKLQMTTRPGRPIRREGMYVRDRLVVEPTDGAILGGQTWLVPPSFRFGFANALLSSPRLPYRTEDAAGTYDIAVNITPGAPLIGVALIDCDARDVTISGWSDVTGTWSDVITPSTPRRLAVSSVRTNKNATLTAGAIRARRDELTGWFYRSPAPATVARRIAGNTPGQASTSAMQPILRIPTSPNATGVVESAELIPRSSVYLLPVATAGLAAISRIRVRFGGESHSRDGAGISLGRLVVGPVVVFPDCYDWGRRIEQQARTTVEETRDGTRMARSDGPRYRVISLDWQGGVETTGATRDTDVGTALTLGGVAIANENTTPYEIEAAHGIADGDARDVVLLTRIPASALVAHREGQILYGSMQATLGLDTVVGTENEDELYRLSVAIREQR